jgi:hypothetical protein
MFQQMRLIINYNIDYNIDYYIDNIILTNYFCGGYRIFTIHLQRTDFNRVVRSDVLKFPIKVHL